MAAMVRDGGWSARKLPSGAIAIISDFIVGGRARRPHRGPI